MVACYQKGYPRPQLVRAGWESLNGIWHFRYDDEGEGLSRGYEKGFDTGLEIIVPFTYETSMSGIGDSSPHECVWYSRSFSSKKENLIKGRLLLHFEGSDYRTTVWVNGKCVGTHEGHCARFTFDITGYVIPEGNNILTVQVEDRMSTALPRGKQRWMNNSFGCWYVQTTGIWKTVWLEYAGDCHLDTVKITPDVDNGRVDFIYELSRRDSSTVFVEAAISFDGHEVVTSRSSMAGTRLSVNLSLSDVAEIWKYHFWSPDSPNLYDVVFSVYDAAGHLLDRAGSYFGLRKISIQNGQVLLNNHPIYQRLILDQGYWKESGISYKGI